MLIRRLTAASFAGVLVAALSASPVSAATSGHTVQTPAGAGVHAIANAYIVQLLPGADARGLARSLGATPTDVYQHAVSGFAAELTAGQLKALQHNKTVLSISQDAVVD